MQTLPEFTFNAYGVLVCSVIHRMRLSHHRHIRHTRYRTLRALQVTDFKAHPNIRGTRWYKLQVNFLCEWNLI